MEGETFLEEFIKLKEGMAKMKERYVKLLSDRDNVFMVADMYHNALNKEEEEFDRITHELEITINSLKVHKDPFKSQSCRSINFKMS